MSKLTKNQRIDKLVACLRTQGIKMRELETRLSTQEKWSDYADNMLTELNHALPDPEYDAKCEANEAAVNESLDRHRERLGLNKPQLKQLDQSVFDGLDEKWRFAAIDGERGIVTVFDLRPIPSSCNNYHTNTGEGNYKDLYELTGYDTTNWKDSLIERDTAKELTGSDYYYSKSVTERLESGQELVMCFVSNVSESDAMQERHVEVITSVDTELNDTDGYGWQYAIPINNQGEPLTASEVGL